MPARDICVGHNRACAARGQRRDPRARVQDQIFPDENVIGARTEIDADPRGLVEVARRFHPRLAESADTETARDRAQYLVENKLVRAIPREDGDIGL